MSLTWIWICEEIGILVKYFLSHVGRRFYCSVQVSSKLPIQPAVFQRERRLSWDTMLSDRFANLAKYHISNNRDRLSFEFSPVLLVAKPKQAVRVDGSQFYDSINTSVVPPALQQSPDKTLYYVKDQSWRLRRRNVSMVIRSLLPMDMFLIHVNSVFSFRGLEGHINLRTSTFFLTNSGNLGSQMTLILENSHR